MLNNEASTEHSKILSAELESELRNFEEFLKRIGFKRIHGSIYGLLVMSEHPLSSSEIEKELNLSQSAVSQGIKTLSMYNAINSQDDRARNCLVHTATLNTLDIVSSVFKKREMETINNYKNMAMRIQSKFIEMGHTENSLAMQRVQSIITTSQLGEIVIEFVIKLSEVQLNEKLQKVIEKLPHVLKLVNTNLPNKAEMFGQLNSLISDKVKNKFQL